MIKIGIYARKSVYKDNSESIDHQIKLAEEYITANYTAADVTHYKDEGISGSDLDRPGFQAMLKDITSGKLDVVISYKLDRISRDVADFSALYKVFVANNVELIPLRDNLKINTDMTPIEKAMMYMNSIFSQVERENTAIRITDSMIDLAKSGYWAGGRPPVGFRLERIVEGGKKHTILTENAEEMDYLNMVADTFLSGHSLNGLETLFKHTNVLTPRTNSFLSATQLWNLLKTPFHAPANVDIYDYYKSLGCKMIGAREDYTGDYGVIVYRRASGSRKKKHVQNPPAKWIVAVGRHKPTMTSDKWLAIQNRFGQNTINKARKYKIGLLKGVLRCSCGSLMRVQRKIDQQYDKVYDSYFCPNRIRKGVAFCNASSVPVDVLDGKLKDILHDIALDKNLINKHSFNSDPISLRNEGAVKKEISILEKKISNLTAALADSSGSAAAKYIVSGLEDLDHKINTLNTELHSIYQAEKDVLARQAALGSKYDAICDVVERIDDMPYEEINLLLCNILDGCVYDGNTLHIHF